MTKQERVGEGQSFQIGHHAKDNKGRVGVIKGTEDTSEGKFVRMDFGNYEGLIPFQRFTDNFSVFPPEELPLPPKSVIDYLSQPSAWRHRGTEKKTERVNLKPHRSITRAQVVKRAEIIEPSVTTKPEVKEEPISVGLHQLTEADRFYLESFRTGKYEQILKEVFTALTSPTGRFVVDKSRLILVYSRYFIGTPVQETAVGIVTLLTGLPLYTYGKRTGQRGLLQIFSDCTISELVNDSDVLDSKRPELILHSNDANNTRGFPGELYGSYGRLTPDHRWFNNRVIEILRNHRIF